MNSPLFSHTRIILILGLLAALGPLSIDMYLPGFPEIRKTFNVPESLVQLSLAAYFAGLALGQLFYGPATDRFGRKTPLYFGLCLYFMSSVTCAFSYNVEMLIISRFFQALGACSGIVACRAMVRDSFEPQDAAKIFSLLMLIMGLAPILAPLAGGYLAKYYGWRTIFYVLASFSFICLVNSRLFLKETKTPDPNIRLKKIIPTYVDILKDRNFLFYTLCGGFAYASMFAYITGSPFVFINLLGIPSEKYGWIFGSNAFALIVASQWNASLLRRHSLNIVLKRVLLALPLFAFLLFCATLGPLHSWAIFAPLFCYMACLGFIYPNTTAAALTHQGARAGSASALLGNIQFIIVALASALVSGLHDGTARPMAGVIFMCSVASTVFFKLSPKALIKS